MQFPLVLAYATTAHKAQGLTTENVIIDFKATSSPNRDEGAFYVAVTRAKRLANVFLRSFDDNMIRFSPVVQAEIARMRQNSKYEFTRTYLSEPMFHPELPQHPLPDIKIVYLNINGLLDSDHIKDLRADHNLMCADVICIAETKLPPSPETKDDDIKINGFEIKGRYDIEKGKMGMVVFAKETDEMDVEVYETHSDNKCQIVKCRINTKKITFVYIHPKYKIDGLRQIEELGIRPDDIMMGDFNIDFLATESNALLSRFVAQNGLAVSAIGVTRNDRTWIDHIIVPAHNLEYYHTVETYKKLYSDHRALAIRISELNLRDMYNLDTDTEMDDD